MTAPPVESPLTVLAGSDQRWRWLLTDSEGAPLNLAAGTFSAVGQVRTWFGGTLLETWADGDQLQRGADGYLTLVLTDEVTASLSWVSGVYDIELTGPDGTHRVAQGPIRVSPEVTTGE